MPPIVLTTVYTDSDSIDGLLSAIGRVSRVDDDATGTLNSRESTYVAWACNVATARVNSFTLTKYDAADLATSWSVWSWATIIACYWLCTRRGNPVPSSLIALYEETMNELAMVKAGQLPIDDLALRNAGVPIWANIRLDDRYWVRKMRVETTLGDQTPNPVPTPADWLSLYATEPPMT